ncbi:MAG: CotH kinase family protein [Armatimonadetes bacterium]|nr:CotH kinase family protein [Armatimonadota bacterium]
MPRFAPSRRGLWIHERGRGRSISWLRLLLPPVLTVVFLLAGLVLSIHRDHVWVGDSAELIRNFSRLDHPAARQAAWRVAQVAGRAFWQVQRATLINLFAADFPPRESPLPTLQLWIPDEAVDAMVDAANYGSPELGHEPGGDRPYMEAFFLDETGRIQEGKASFRGVSYWHRMPEKPSFRVRIRKEDMEKSRGHRYVELQRPEDTLAFKATLSETVARELGLVASRSEPVRLILNGKYRGVYLRTYRPGEQLALLHGRLPGVFFKGDRFDQQSLWADRSGWAAYPPDVPEPQNAVLDELLETVRGWRSGQPGPVALARLLDLESYARWAALVIAAGSTHVDDHHNHVYFYSPYAGKLEPAVWDLNGYGSLDGHDLDVNVVFNQLYFMVMHDPAWVHRRNVWLYEIVQGAGSREAAKRLLDAHFETAGADLRSDPHLAEIRRVFDQPHLREELPQNMQQRLYYLPDAVTDLEQRRSELLSWVAARNQRILEFLEDSRVAVQATPRGSVVAVFGSVAVRAEQPGKPSRLLFPAIGMPEMRGPRAVLPAAPMFYELGAPPNQLRFFNAVTGAALRPESALPAARSVPRPIRLSPLPAQGTVSLGPGDVHLTRDLVVGPGQTLRIAPGTTLRLAPGVNLYSRGRVEAMGTEEAPIQVRGLDPGRPWGCFGLVGPATRGSRLRHVKLEGGSPGRFEGVEFLGQFSVYGCPDLRLEQCTFGTNPVGDDAVNLGDSAIEILGCRWQGAAFDGLDLDQCRGTLQDCRWSASGNDGLDLMASRVQVRNCRFEGSGDKGISAGEGSTALVSDSLFQACKIGLQTKDGSRVRVDDSRFLGNEIAVDAYRKKVFYQMGGQALLSRCRLEGSQEADLRLDAFSRLWLRTTAARLPVDNQGLVELVSTPPAFWTEAGFP